uniref:Putative HSP18.0 n=1 Tax=Davidia involucrata TaxID=16924 RepID=A0A5B7ANB1_DAVIN
MSTQEIPLKMDFIQSFFGGQQSNVFDPFSLDIWDPFEGSPFSGTVANVASSARETTAFANPRTEKKTRVNFSEFKLTILGGFFANESEFTVEIGDDDPCFCSSIEHDSRSAMTISQIS